MNNKLTNKQDNKQTEDKTTVINVFSMLLAAGFAYVVFTNPLEISSLYLALMSIAIFIFWSYVSSKTSTGVRFIAFSKETRIELLKVVWPKKDNVVQTTIMVLIAVIIMAIFLWAVDSVFTYLVQAITDIR